MASQVPIAIIGMSCRFSGDATSPEKLWKLCAESKSGWSKIPEDRFNLDAFYHPNGQKLDTLNIKGGHFLKEDVALFDAHFFNYTSDLAAAIDPQFRLQLESTYEAMESAGLTMNDVKGSNTSVFAGTFFGDYSDMNIRDPETLPRALLVGVGSAMASNRISHFYDLRGPSMTVDTGCSTTLTAFHQACQSLANGESDMSIVGASNVILNPDNFMVMSSSFLSEAGRCFAFDSRASGYGRGEGTATVIVKRLDDALKNGDPIRAIVRSTAVNQDGKTETITTPSPEAQTALIRQCYAQAGLDPALTTYFEAHGTGTPTGDPIEARAVASNFSNTRKAFGSGPLKIGSVKTNIGHTETVSGLASIIKVVMALEKEQIPPSINFEKPNPNIPFEEYNLQVATSLEFWSRLNGIRRASINNFGYGGANAHVVVEDYQSFLSSTKHITNGSTTRNLSETIDQAPSSKVFILSAKDEQAALKMASDLKQHLLEIQPDDERRYLDNLAYTLGQRRTRFPWVASHSARSIMGLVQALDSVKMKPAKAIEPPKIGFVFTGQGAQWWAMGRELIEAYPVYKQSVLEAEGYLREFGCQWSLIDELTRSPETTNVNELAFSTPLCAVLQISLVRLLASWGIKPQAITSHSSGEVAAAYAAGALTLRSAMAIVFARGQVAGRKIPGVIETSGGMVATGLGPEALEKYIARVTSGQVMVACLNSPSSTTASGDAAAVEELESLLKQDDIFARRLKINAAYHSHHMQVLAAPYLEWLQKLFGPQEHMNQDVIYSSPTTGKRETSGRMISDPQHWVNSFANPVRFVESFHNMCFSDSTTTTSYVDIVIEVGPHAALGGPIQEIIAQPNFHGCKVGYLPTLVRKNDAVDTMQALAASLVKAGYPVNMEAVNFPTGQRNTEVLYDLPSYPWTHKTRHWSEPRVNKTHRHRAHAANDLLGSLVLGTNMTRPSWRHVIRLNDLPWLRDHVVQSTMLYPGAGFICMAIEGASQLAQDRGDQVTGYELRDIEVLKGLQIPDTSEGIEVQLTLEPCNDKAIYASGCQEFHVYSVDSQENWTEHCKGLIHVETTSSDDQQTLIALKSRLSQLSLHKPVEEYRKNINPMDVYDAMHFVQICHGPIFQNLESIKVNGRQSIASFSVADTAATMPYRHESDYIVHPTTIDSLFQAAYAGYIAVPDANMSASFIPRVIKKLYVAHNIPKVAGHKFTAYCDVVSFTQRGFDTDLLVTGEKEDGSKTPLLKIDHYITQSLGNVKSMTGDAYDKLSTLHWGPDLSLPNEAYLEKRLGFESEALTNLKRVCLHYIQDTIDALTIADVAQLKSHHKKYYVWIKLQRELALQNKLADNSSEWLNDSPAQRAALIDQLLASGKVGEDVCRYGPHILSILRGELDPSDLIQEDVKKPMTTLNSSQSANFHAQVAEYVRLYTHQNPRSKIFEIGGGAGTVTTTILDAIGVESDFSADSYTFTESEAKLVSDAEEKFGSYAGLVQCKQFIAEQDISKQGFETGVYNLIILSDTQQIAGNPEANLKNIRRLLSPNGRILILEEGKLPFILGLFPDLWTTGDDDERSGLNSSTGNWAPVLKSSGFSSVEATIPESRNKAFSSVRMIVARAEETSIPSYALNVALVLGSKATPPAWVANLKVAISEIIQGEITVEPLESIDPSGRICIYLGDIEHSILKNPSREEFEAVKNLCVKSKGLIWVTRGGAVDCQNLDASLSQGFLRTLRTEYAGKRAITLDLDPETEAYSETSIKTLAAIFRKSFDYSQKGNPMDFEYAERNGTINVPRFYKDLERNSLYFPDPAQPQAPKPGQFFQKGRPLRLQVGTPGLLDTLSFCDDLDALKDLPDGFIEIEPKVFGVNFRDVMTAMGQLQSDFMGFECSGVVKQISQAATESGLKVGDRVTTLMKGHYSSSVRVPWTSAVRIPDTIGYDIAASLPMAYATAYISLLEMARLERGEKVLIHAAMGGVGQAAINLAKNVGAEIFATVGSAEKREALISHYGIPDDHIFSSRSTSFATGVHAATGGKGVDVVLNSLSGSLLQESFDCLAQFGRFVEIGKRDLELNNSLQMQTFTRNVSFYSLDLIQLEDHKGHIINRVMKEVIRLFDQGAIATAIPFTTYPLSEIGKPFRLMQAGRHMGRIVVTVEPDVSVPIIPKKPTAQIDPQSSYLVVGGLGGIGRSVCQWLAQRGAKNIIVLSRSANAEKIRPFAEEMQHMGCKIYPVASDISDSVSMARALEDCRSNMPPVRGVIQGAMVLQDSIMEQMTVDQYMAAIRPKVQGTWNLHEQFLGQDLDFFVMLSSLSGIVGLPSQCNYAAGGSYEDALARYRITRGLPAAVVDIGVVQAVGVVAENQDLAEGLRRLGYKPLIEDHVLTAIESIIADPPKSQVLIGLDGADWESSGLIRDSRFTALKVRDSAQSNGGGAGAGSAGELSSLLANASSKEAAVTAVAESISKKLVEIFLMAEEDVDPSKPPTTYGVDSLSAVELRNMLSLKAGAEISIFKIMQSASITDLAASVVASSSFVDPSLLTK